MATRMLIDARHPEETRVAVLKGNRIEEFDFESADHKQIKGNIYLAKVTRVEPSLQAAFVDFGGNRHGFLAFSEIHPDYYQIPKEDREALLAEEAAAAEEEAALRAVEDDESDYGESALDRIEDHDHSEDMGGGLGELTEVDSDDVDHVATIEGGHVENGFDDNDDDSEDDADRETDDADADDADSDENGDDKSRPRRGRRRQQGRARSKQAEEIRAKRMALRRRYKIQDVIQRRQVLLVQVVKEERGNKGAALTTYLSLAGRYCVLMPNSTHGGGISRKINSVSDRKRLKQIVSEMNLPKSMGCIVRTAGLQRTKTEIKRDFDYLARLWDEIRENTLKSTAPALIHSDSDLIKRAIRDIYNGEIEDVVVEGEEGYRAAREFMKLLMPSHARRVKQYADPVPLFQRYGAEDQLSAMYDPMVQLKSGGYLVINPTEALVSIDINSGRSTKEHGIEQTALNTNLEAAREIARQLRLRDMAGLVVIDFIDMDYGSNVRKVEKAMKDALKNDRARIQVGRISSFGLMEMSRQRLRTGVLEATTRGCPHCDGTGLVRTASSAGLAALRLIEDEAGRGKGSTITLYASTEAAIYLLNSKRTDLAQIEDLYGVTVEVIPEGENEGAKMRVASSGPRPEKVPTFAPLMVEEDDLPFEEDEEDEGDGEGRDDGFANNGDDDGARKKRRRRRGGRGRKRGDRQDEGEAQERDSDDAEDAPGADQENGDEATDARAENGDEAPRKRRRRGGRGRRKPENGFEAADDANTVIADEPADGAVSEAIAPDDDSDRAAAAEIAEEPKPKARRTRRKAAETPVEETSGTDATAAEIEEVTPEPKAKRTRRKKADAIETVSADESTETEEDAPKPKRTRRKKADAAADESPAPVADTATVEPAPPVAEEAPAAAPTVAEPHEPTPANDEPARDDAESDDGQGPRRGWWQRTFGN